MKYLIEHWPVIATILTPIAGFFTGWKLRKINEKKEGASALDSIQKVYDTFADQTNKKFDELYKEISSLKKENHQQREDMRDLQKDNRDLHKEVNKLVKKNNELLMENQKLKLKQNSEA